MQYDDLVDSPNSKELQPMKQTNSFEITSVVLKSLLRSLRNSGPAVVHSPLITARIFSQLRAVRES